MYKFLKLLGVLAVVACSIDHASATSTSAQPIFVTGPSDDFVFSYSTGSAFTLSSLSFAPTSSPSSNLLTSLSPYTSSIGGSLNGTGTLSEIISAKPGTPYVVSYTYSGAPNSLSVSVSAVPLPASFPLFAMALIGLGLIGYRKARKNGGFFTLDRQPCFSPGSYLR
jgi:hypothetical protein